MNQTHTVQDAQRDIAVVLELDTKERMNMGFRLKAVMTDIKGGNELKTVTLLNITRDCIIHCNEHNLGYYLKNFNYDGETKFWE